MISALVMGALLYGPQTPEAERIKRLTELFEPRPGKLLTHDRISFLENSKKPELIKGEIWIRPPKGQCLIIRSDREQRDLTVCKATPFKWTVDSLDSFGRFRLHATIMAEWDEGTDLTWETPYRIGNFVPAGDKDTNFSEDIVIKSCKAKVVDDERIVLLEAFDGRRWKIMLPEFDTPVLDEEPEIPNLMVHVDSKKQAESKKAEEKKAEDHKDPHAAEGEAKKDEKAPAPTEPQGGGSVLGTLLTKGYNKEEAPKVTYNIRPRSAFKMESGRFTETGSPKGMTGECRYIFKNAPGDSSSGAIECNDTDTMDSLYVHVPCFSKLKINEKKKIPKDKDKDQSKDKKESSK